MTRDHFPGLFTIHGGRPLAGVDWPPESIPGLAELPPARPSSDFLATDVLPYPTGAIVAGRNYVYCATFLLAWEDAGRIFGNHPLRIAGDPPMVLELNRHTFDHRNLSEESFVARAGPGDEGFRDRLREEIVLSKILPGATLDATIAQVRQGIADPDARHIEKRLVSQESLVVPKLLVSIERQFSEITGRDVLGTGMFISAAMQIIRFRLDETGALLESEAAIVSDDGRRTLPGRRKFIFDRPFLIYLIERDADQPYFAAWVENAELMVPLAQ